MVLMDQAPNVAPARRPDSNFLQKKLSETKTHNWYFFQRKASSSAGATLECANISAASHSPLIRRAALESNVNLAQKKRRSQF